MYKFNYYTVVFVLELHARAGGAAAAGAQPPLRAAGSFIITIINIIIIVICIVICYCYYYCYSYRYYY